MPGKSVLLDPVVPCNHSILDIVQGNSKAHKSKPGYDLVTGLGSINDTSALVNYFIDNVE